jgi:hypothetical protein
MSEEKINVEQLIDLLGGPTKTAALCEVTKSAVSQWKNNGIPKAQLKFLRAVRRKAVEAAMTVPTSSTQ